MSTDDPIRDLDAARKLGEQLASVAMARLGSLVAKDSQAPPDIQLKAAEDILEFAFASQQHTKIAVPVREKDAEPDGELDE